MRPDQEARLTMFALVALYFFLVFDTLRTVVVADRVVAYMLMTIVAVLLVGALVVRWEPRAMSLILLIAAVLQGFGLGVMLILHWRDVATAVWLMFSSSRLYVRGGLGAAVTGEETSVE
jgi:hypothetical protein